MNKIHYKRRGFTIVELTIVIAVIAILMTITIVAYTGVQRKARNAQTASAVTEYKQALILHRSMNRMYPVFSTLSCLGKEYPGNLCWKSTAADPALTNLLEQAAGGKLNMPAIAPNGIKGAVYVSANLASPVMLDGVASNFIAYSVEGNEKCNVGPVVSVLNNNNFTMSSTPPATGRTYPIDSNGTVECWLSLPNK